MFCERADDDKQGYATTAKVKFEPVDLTESTQQWREAECDKRDVTKDAECAALHNQIRDNLLKQKMAHENANDLRHNQESAICNDMEDLRYERENVWRNKKAITLIDGPERASRSCERDIRFGAGEKGMRAARE